MKNKMIIPIFLVIISIILFIISLILLLNTNYLNNSNKNKEKESGIETNKQEIQIDEQSQKNDTESTDKNTTNKDTTSEDKVNDNNVINNKDEVSNNKKDEETVKYTEEDVVSYFSNREKEIGNNQEDKSVREKVKESFISIIDFIFYDKEIKGYTFDELTTNAKLKVIEIALSIDNKIDKYFPDYKDTIKDKYTDIKGKLAVKYLEFTQNLCDSVGTDVCNQAKEDFNNMKESFGFTWELIKELAKSGSSKVKDFYESWKDSK